GHLCAELVVAEQRDEEREEEEGGAEDEGHEQRQLGEALERGEVPSHQEPQDGGAGGGGCLRILVAHPAREQPHHQADEGGGGSEEEEEHQNPRVPEGPEQLGAEDRQGLEDGAQRGLRAYQRRLAEVFTASEIPSYHGGTCALRFPSYSSPGCSLASPPRTRRSIHPRFPTQSSSRRRPTLRTPPRSCRPCRFRCRAGSRRRRSPRSARGPPPRPSSPVPTATARGTW